MSDSGLIVDPPLKGEWAILNPPGHPRLAFDFLAAKGRKLPYAPGLFLRHLFSTISVEETYAWRKPVFAPADGVVVACWDGAPATGWARWATPATRSSRISISRS